MYVMFLVFIWVWPKIFPTVFGVATAVKKAELPSPGDACGILVPTYCDSFVIIYSSLLQLPTARVKIVCVRGPKQVGPIYQFLSSWRPEMHTGLFQPD